jgi:hypothetical protein
MSTTENTSFKLHADPEHSGIRAAVVIILAAVFVLTFALVGTVLNALPKSGIGGYVLPLSCVIGLLAGLGIAGVAEQLLKRRWHSDKSVILNGDGVEVRIAEETTISLDWTKRMATTNWYFSLKGYPRGGRERRVPSSWLCLACQLQQDEHLLVVFSYLPADKAKPLLENGAFHEIRPVDLYDLGPFRRRIASTDRPKLPANLLTGKDGPYWLAERRRWSTGLELTAKDLALFLDTVNGHVEEWGRF